MRIATLPFAVARLARNLWMDLRYGAFLGGAVDNRYPGAMTVGSTDYAVMDQIFGGRVRGGDVLVDVGCGKGRVLNWWLDRYPGHRMVGLELMEEIAARAARRLAPYPSVRICSGDAVANLPIDGTLFYLFNPFDRANMARFKARMSELCRVDPQRRILYFAPVFVDVFELDPQWRVTLHEIRRPRAGKFEERHRHVAEIEWTGVAPKQSGQGSASRKIE